MRPCKGCTWAHLFELDNKYIDAMSGFYKQTAKILPSSVDLLESGRHYIYNV
jgi:hypothetical protein